MNMKYQSITVLQNLLISNSQLAKTNLACATDETKLWLSPSAKQRRNPCSGPHLCIRIWVRNMTGLLKKAIVDLPHFPVICWGYVYTKPDIFEAANFFYMHRPSVPTNPVNPDIETELFWNRSSEAV